ncbi:MAG: ribulose-phosphate 3-epimerase [Pirellulaceae bacterium]|nr:ribulose-phosphate 3-epimerase [Pirellulaceae bacterium]
MSQAAPVVLPSLLLCDFGNLEREIRRLEDAGVRALHLDVMDGQFVPNMTYGMPIVEACRRLTKLPLDVHIMIANPARYVRQFMAAGADNLTFHIEATAEPRPVIEQIHSLGGTAGIALNPATPLSAIDGCLDLVDVVLVMSVPAGFGGQKFHEVAIEKLQQLRRVVRPEVILEGDGGINEQTIARCHAAGCQFFVVGSAIFGRPDYATAVQGLVVHARS